MKISGITKCEVRLSIFAGSFLLLLLGNLSAAPTDDPCTDASRAAISEARDYQKGARTVRSACTKENGDCASSEAFADGVLNELIVAHQAMLDACDMLAPPQPPVSPVYFGDLVINEVMIDPGIVSDADGEWIEIYNPTLTDFNLNGITFRISSDAEVVLSEFVIDWDLIIPSYGFVVVGRTQDLVLNDNVPVDHAAAFDLPNTGFVLGIFNGTTLLDDVSFYSHEIIERFSRALLTSATNALDNDYTFNWFNGTGLYGSYNRGTPGAHNVDY